MRHKLILYFLIVSLTATLIIAAGGGGGGGSGNSGGSSGGSSGTTSGGGSVPYFSNVECNDKGVLSFEQKPAVKPVTAHFEDGSVLDIPGEWEGSTFTSEEAVTIKKGEYTIPDPKNGNKTVQCPGLKFSCKIVKLSLQECKMQGKEVIAKFRLENAVSDDLRFQFSSADKGFTYDKSAYSIELQSMQIYKGSNHAFELHAQDLPEISLLEVSLPECTGQYYIYSQIPCIRDSISSSQEETPGTKLKCGGYLDIKDRVQCRLQLRDEQKNEYENFFPEECRSWENKDVCIALYQKVHPCWKLPDNKRIECLRQKVGIATVKQEKEKCLQLAKGERGSCISSLEQNVHSMIKLHLYHLEEKAEELEEDGKINQEQLVDFVVKMENSKLRYNQVTSKEQRKQIILQARQYWLELVKKVKV